MKTKEITFQSIRDELAEERVAEIRKREIRFLFFISILVVIFAIFAKIIGINQVFFVAGLFLLAIMLFMLFVKYFWKIPSPKISDAEVKSRALNLYKEEKEHFLVALRQKDLLDLDHAKKRIKEIEAVLGLDKR